MYSNGSPAGSSDLCQQRSLEHVAVVMMRSFTVRSGSVPSSRPGCCVVARWSWHLSALLEAVRHSPAGLEQSTRSCCGQTWTTPRVLDDTTIRTVLIHGSVTQRPLGRGQRSRSGVSGRPEEDQGGCSHLTPETGVTISTRLHLYTPTCCHLSDRSHDGSWASSTHWWTR